jgi:hypothetical protein
MFAVVAITAEGRRNELWNSFEFLQKLQSIIRTLALVCRKKWEEP